MKQSSFLVVASYIALLPFYIGYFFLMVQSDTRPSLLLHFAVMAYGAVSAGILLVDVYRRDFRDPNSKVTWALLILFLAPFSWPFYLWRLGRTPA